MNMFGILVAGRRALVALALFCSVPAGAQESAEAPPDWEKMRVQVRELHVRARHMRAQADKTRADAEHLCRDKLLFASCMTDAKTARQEAEHAIFRMEREAADLERRLRYHDLETKQARRAEQAEQEAADTARRAEEIRRQDEKRRLKEEKRVAKEARRRQASGD